MSTAEVVEVCHPYTAQAEDEHNLKVGDIITNVSQVADGWCEGVLNGRKALFPDNFVKPAAAPPVSASVGISATGEKSFAAPRGKQNGTAAGGVGVSELKNKLGNIIGGPPPAARGLRKNKKARVTHQYTSQHEDELSLEVGAVIDVMRTEGEEGWWEGNLNGKVGMFPSNFVEVIDSSDEKSGESEIKGKKVEGVGFGNIFAGGAPIVLRPTKPEKKDGAAEGVKVEPGASRMSVKGKPPPVIPGMSAACPAGKPEPLRAKVLFPYTAENDDELSLAEGQVIVVLDQDLEDKGWWKGELNGKVGVFPDNFVELIPPTPSSAPAEVKRPMVPQTSVTKEPHPASKPAPVVKAEEPVKPSAGKPLWGDKKVAKIPPDAIKQESVDLKSKPDTGSSSSNEKLSSLPTGAPKPGGNKPPGRPAVGPSGPPDSAPVVPSGPVLSKPKDGPTSVPMAMGAKGAVGAGISPEQYAELQREIAQLKEAVEQTKKSQEKQFIKLMNEIDEEKKTRLSLQVEIDRLKKFISND